MTQSQINALAARAVESMLDATEDCPYVIRDGSQALVALRIVGELDPSQPAIPEELSPADLSAYAVAYAALLANETRPDISESDE